MGCRGRSRSSEQLFDAVDELLDGKWFAQALHAGLSQEATDFGIVAKTSHENEATLEFRSYLSGLAVKIITPHLRHHDVTDDCIVVVGRDLRHCFVTIMSNLHKEVLASQN